MPERTEIPLKPTWVPDWIPTVLSDPVIVTVATVPEQLIVLIDSVVMFWIYASETKHDGAAAKLSGSPQIHP